MAETNLFKEGIRSLPPGKEVFALFDQLPARVDQGLPDDYGVTVSYSDGLGNNYSETMTVGYGSLREVGRMHRHDIHDAHKRLDELVREVKKWTYYAGGLKVMTEEDARRHEAEESERWEALQPDQDDDEVEQLGPDGMRTQPPPASPAEENDGGV